MSFQLSTRWACRPQHAINSQSAGEEICQDSRAAGITGEITEKVGRLPVGDPRQNKLIYIMHNRFHGFSDCGRVIWETGPYSTWLYLG